MLENVHLPVIYGTIVLYDQLDYIYSPNRFCYTSTTPWDIVWVVTFTSTFAFIAINLPRIMESSSGIFPILYPASLSSGLVSSTFYLVKYSIPYYIE